MSKTYNVYIIFTKDYQIWIQKTKMKVQTTEWQNATKGGNHKLQKAKQVQTKANLLSQSYWLPTWHQPVFFKNC